jgi:eukaryotic-like serine/threonine-protein kinase
MEAVAPAQRLAGRYVLDELIATGGMAEVWRGHDQVLARTVAVKILRSDLAGDPGLAARFQREAIAVAGFTHPEIISVFDTGVEGGIHFIVMEYFSGRSLRQVMEAEGPMDAGRTAALIRPVLTGLAFAHAEGLVHRDIKPANILVGDDGRVKVADFGIAKAVQGAGDATTTGVVFGTARYVAPEQVSGGSVDPRTDLYSVGVVMYEMLTGRPPFTAETDLATAMMRLSVDPPPPRAIRSGIPRAVDAVVRRAMARRSDDRFSSAEAMRAALDRADERTGPDTAPIALTRPIPPPPEPSDRGASTLSRNDGGRPSRRRSALRSWVLVPAVIVVAALVVVGSGLAVGRLELGGPLGVRAPDDVAGASSGEPLQIVRAEAFDPQPGDGSENPSQMGFVVDGNPDTVWRTSHYTTPAFGGVKDGVGVWIDLAGKSDVDEVTITSPLSGWTFQIRPGTPQAGMGAPVTGTEGDTTFAADASGRTIVRLAPFEGSGLFVWITGLVPDEGQYAAAIAEVVVEGQRHGGR